MTREQVQDLLAMVQATYPNYNPPSKTAAVNAWTMALEEYNANEAAMAFKTYMKTNTSGFAPTPGQLIEKIHTITQPQELNEMEAWSLVSKAIRNSSYNSESEYAKLPPVVQSAVGMPSQLRQWALDEGYNEEVVMSQFQRCYRTELKRQEEFQKLPSDVRMLIQNNSRNSHKAQIKDKRCSAIKSSLEDRNTLRIENKEVGVPMPEHIKEKIKGMRF